MNEKMVAIAQDIIKNIDFFQLSHSAYLRINANTCEVCALGAVLFASVKRNLADKNAYWRTDLDYYLTDTVLSAEQMDLIENCYECNNAEFNPEVYIATKPEGYEYDWDENPFGFQEGPEFDAARAFGKLWSTDRSRILAIMQNIIGNDGEFIPPAIE